MTAWMGDLIRRAILARYKNGPWGYVPYPRRVPLFKGLKKARGKVYSTEYERLARHRDLLRPMGWPFGQHSLMDVRHHLVGFFGCTPESQMLAEQADVYAAFIRNNTDKLGPQTADGAKAFLAIWRHIEHQFKDECDLCRRNIECGLASKRSVG